MKKIKTKLIIAKNKLTGEKAWGEYEILKDRKINKAIREIVLDEICSLLKCKRENLEFLRGKLTPDRKLIIFENEEKKK